MMTIITLENYFAASRRNRSTHTFSLKPPQWVAQHYIWWCQSQGSSQHSFCWTKALYLIQVYSKIFHGHCIAWSRTISLLQATAVIEASHWYFKASAYRFWRAKITKLALTHRSNSQRLPHTQCTMDPGSLRLNHCWWCVVKISVYMGAIRSWQISADDGHVLCPKGATDLNSGIGGQWKPKFPSISQRLAK